MSQTQALPPGAASLGGGIFRERADLIQGRHAVAERWSVGREGPKPHLWRRVQKDLLGKGPFE